MAERCMQDLLGEDKEGKHSYGAHIIWGASE